jgi:phage baseplate assembly protein W
MNPDQMSIPAVAFPLHLDAAGETARIRSLRTDAEQLIEELLFTSLGERLNRPDLGCGLLELVFQPASDELRAATQFQVTAELQRWLGDLIRVLSVEARTSGPELTVSVTYALLTDDVASTAVFVR